MLDTNSVPESQGHQKSVWDSKVDMSQLGVPSGHLLSGVSSGYFQLFFQ